MWQKDSINKYLGRIAVKKPLWIIESGNTERWGDFTAGLIWAQRLCAGARVGINVIMRKPSVLSLTEPTPVTKKIYKIFSFLLFLEYNTSYINKDILIDVCN